MLLPGREGEDELQSLQVSLQFFRTLFIVAHLLNLSEHQLVVFMSTHCVEGATLEAKSTANHCGGTPLLSGWRVAWAAELGLDEINRSMVLAPARTRV